MNPNNFQLSTSRISPISINRFNSNTITSSEAIDKPKLLKADGQLIAPKDIKQGDLLLGPDGTSRCVLSVHKDFCDLYEIIPRYGSPYIVSKDYIFSNINNGCKDNSANISAHEWLLLSQNQKDQYSLFKNDIALSFSKVLSNPIILEPYFLGFLLSSKNLSNTVWFSILDKNAVTYLNSCLLDSSMGLMIFPISRSKRCCCLALSKRHSGQRKSRLQGCIELSGLFYKKPKDKFIPFQYKTASSSERLELLAGIIDSCGTIFDNKYVIKFCSKRLAEDVAYVANSCGISAFCQTASNLFTTRFVVEIHDDQNKIPCKSRKKLSSKELFSTSMTFDIRYVGLGEHYGVTVDGDNRYLLSNFIIAHGHQITQ